MTRAEGGEQKTKSKWADSWFPGLNSDICVFVEMGSHYVVLADLELL